MTKSIDELINSLSQLTQDALVDIENANTSDDLKNVRVKYTGSKGLLNPIQGQMRNLEKDERPQLGQGLQKFHASFNEAFEAKTQAVEEAELNQQLESERIDISLPGRRPKFGSRHILTQTQEEIEDFFIGMGYQVMEGYEVELDLYNFEKMNLPPNHPARDMQDTFYIDDELLLRTHTSPMQARAMEAHDFTQGPLKMISPGKVYRRDTDDATHSHQFMQVEGLVVDEKITLGDLKGTLLAFAKAMFGEDRQIRLRPSFFSFTEPSVEVDISWFEDEDGNTEWMEILGAGVIHPNVLEMSGVDSSKYSGFAFGLGIERVAMLRHDVDDIRHFYQNDLRFLQQFMGGDR